MSRIEGSDRRRPIESQWFFLAVQRLSEALYTMGKACTEIQESERNADDVDLHRGQYSDATLNELESQNDGQVEGILGKVKILKDVCLLLPPPPLHTYI